MSTATSFDVFLSHNSQDKPAVRELKERLSARSRSAWLDEDELQPGLRWQQLLELGIKASKSIAVLVGKDGLGPWEDEEMQAALRLAVKDKRSVIPVLLPGAPTQPELPAFLANRIWVDLRAGLTDEGLDKLVWGITGEKPIPPQVRKAAVQPVNRITWRDWLRAWLIADFIERDGDVFQGHFAAKTNPNETKRWQSQGGEVTDHPGVPKLPYYLTYWGFRAAAIVAPDDVTKWRPITAGAIQRHFGNRRWLKVIRDYAFAKGPTARPTYAESVRHSARAADLLCMLDSGDARISETAWNLVDESGTLQNPDGGWNEFRGPDEKSSLWSTVYVFRFLATLAQPAVKNTLPDERDEFLRKASVLLNGTEAFLHMHWLKHRWATSADMTWQESAAAVLPEVARFLTDEAFVRDCYYSLRASISPAGRLNPDSISSGEGASDESVQALRIAFALKSACYDRALADSRYQRLSQWISEHLTLASLATQDIAFAASVMDLDSDARL